MTIDSLWIYSDALASGALLTMIMNVLAVALGAPGAILLFAMRTSKNFAARTIAIIVIELFKGIPALVLMFWLYLCLPLVTPIRISAQSSAVITLAINYGVNASEVFRSAWGSVSSEIRDNLVFFGISRKSSIVFFEIPFLFRASIPGLLAILAANIKLSAIAAFIAVPEIFHATQAAIQQTYQPILFYTALAVFYVTVVGSITLVERLARRGLGRE